MNAHLHSKRTDFLILIGLVVVGYIYSRLTTGLYIGRDLFGAIIFCLPGTIYLGLRAPKPWKKILLSTLIFGVVFGSFFEFLQQYNLSYVSTSTVFPKIFGVLAIDATLWHVFMATFVLTFYEHFINRDKYKTISRRALPVLIIGLIVFLVTVILYYVHPSSLHFKYAYVDFGTLAVLPVFLLAYKKPQYIKDMTLIAPFFLFLYLVIEWVGVPRHWWIYTGHAYLGFVSIQSLRFPLEELLYWMLLYPAALVSYYKIFIDRPTKT